MRILSLILIMICSTARADTLVMKEFDQIKLGELMGRLPDSVATKSIIGVPGELPGTEAQITFPSGPQGFQIFCRRTFYNGSPYPSFTACSVTIDPTHASHDRSYDEIRFNVTDPTLVQALYTAIPYGNPLKEFYSWERNLGTSYEGNSRDVFHYRIECTPESCMFRFSGISTII